ncbi:hypothetical protein Y032_0012g1672 [Ancylostoma ceylanicum]|uniref:Uncharacterized protein n=1 Tax=Ancylostoma ceylanicum TaxID=53326 RepID=A0A016VDI6_9BILA|nr:hypothetical protein Y032_0012g1672 [Ancylostoma ceylanicum]
MCPTRCGGPIEVTRRKSISLLKPVQKITKSCNDVGAPNMETITGYPRLVNAGRTFKTIEKRVSQNNGSVWTIRRKLLHSQAGLRSAPQDQDTHCVFRVGVSRFPQQELMTPLLSAFESSEFV